MGYDYSVSTMHLFEQRRSLPLVSKKGAVRPGALRKRFKSESLFPPIFKCWLPEDCRRKSGIKYSVPDATAQPGNTAVAVRPSVYQENKIMVARIAAA